MSNKNNKPKFKGLKKILKPIYAFFKGIYKIIDKIIITPLSKLLLRISNLFSKNDRPLDRLFNNKSFLIVLALALACLAFFTIDRQGSRTQSANIEYGKPVTVLYNEEAYVVEGLPETVDITMIGRKSDLYLAKQYPNDKVTIDLRDLKEGSHRVKIKYNGSVSSVEYKVDPSYATVVIYEKESITRQITKEVLNENKLESKYSISNITYARDDVYVKGAKYKLDQVATVKALVDVTKITNIKAGENTLKEIPLIAYDSNGDKLDVEIVPATIDATVTISTNSKEVPFIVLPEGDVKFGKSIESIELSQNKVTIYGDNKALADVTSIPVKVDVTDLEDNASITINITKPTGIKDISVKAVVAKVTLGETKEKTIDNINIETRNLGSGLVVQAASQQDSSVPVIVKGTERNISSLTTDDITAYVDLQGLGVGEHKVAVNVTGSNLNVSYKPKTTTITIIIRK